MNTEQAIQQLAKKHLPLIEAALLKNDESAVSIERRAFLRALADTIDEMRVERPSCPLPLAEWPEWANFAAGSMQGTWGYYEAKPEPTNFGTWMAQVNTAQQQSDYMGKWNDNFRFSIYSREEMESIEAACSLISTAE